VKSLLALVLVAALPWAANADNSRLALGLAATLDHEFMNQSGKSEYRSTADTVGVMFGFPLGDAWRSAVTLSVIEQSVNDRSALVQPSATEYRQAGMVVGLGFSYPLASTGPFAVRVGITSTLGFLGRPSNGSGAYSNVFGTISLPVTASAAINQNWVVQVSLPVVTAAAKRVTASGKTTGMSSVRMNNGYSPTVAVLYNF